MLLGISEGKDTCDTIQSLLINLLQEMESYESGFIVDNDMFLIQYHWGGDMIFLIFVRYVICFIEVVVPSLFAGACEWRVVEVWSTERC